MWACHVNCAYTRRPVADLSLDLGLDLSPRLVDAVDVEGKIPRTLEALGPLAGRDVVLLDGAGGLRARQLSSLGARLTVMASPGRARALRAALGAMDGSAPPRVATGSSRRTGLADGSADALVSCWSDFRDDPAADSAEADRILRPGGRVLVLHDYGRDDVSRLRPADLPEYTTWSRRDGWFLKHGFRVHVVHCWWTFDSLESGRAFLAAAFGHAGGEVGASLVRPRLSYNVAIYHRSKEIAQGLT
jgi:hypothetical protein